MVKTPRSTDDDTAPSAKSRRGKAAPTATNSRVRRSGDDELPDLGSMTLVVGKDDGSVELARLGIRSAFYHRLRRWAEDVALNAPEEVLANALANPSVRGGLVALLTDTAADVDLSRITELRDRALARGLAAKEELRERAGGFAPTAWVSKVLKISRQAVDKRRKAGKLLAIQTADGTFAYPLCQFSDDGVVPGLEDALAALQAHSPWERLSALVNPSPALGRRSAIGVLAAARTAEEKNQALAVLRDFLQ